MAPPVSLQYQDQHPTVGDKQMQQQHIHKPKGAANLNLSKIALAVCGITGACHMALAQESRPVPPENVVTVTGTSIRGVAAVGSSVDTLRREDIVATGATTATELLRSIPEMNNFSASNNNMGQNQANFVDQPAIH